MFGNAQRPPILDVFTIRPPPFFRNSGMKVIVTSISPSRLTSRTYAQMKIIVVIVNFDIQSIYYVHVIQKYFVIVSSKF